MENVEGVKLENVNGCDVKKEEERTKEFWDNNPNHYDHPNNVCRRKTNLLLKKKSSYEAWLNA